MQDFIRASLADQGFATIAVGDPQGTWAYSVGFTDLGHPEVLISGLHQKHCHEFLWSIFRAIQGGKVYKHGEVDNDLGNLPCAFRLMQPEAAAEFGCQAFFWYEDQGKTPTFLQLVLPDSDGRLPWEAGYNAHQMRCQRHLWLDLH